MRVLGLDEAGRGCVLGPLVVGAYFCDDNGPSGQSMDAVVATGATDSKMLSRKRREAILLRLADVGESRLVAISPAQIDAGNINALEEAAFIEHIVHFRPHRVYIDAPVHPKGIAKLKARMAAILAKEGLDPELIVEPKADANYPIVGAASIVAKVYRDNQIDALGEVGSGYPSDPTTRAWLSGFLKRGDPLPDCVRKRWGTIDNLRQQVLF